MPNSSAVSEIVRLQGLLVQKQQEFTKGLRDSLPSSDLKVIHEELERLYKAIIEARAKL